MRRPSPIRRIPSIRAVARTAALRLARGGANFVVRVWDKAGQDDIFFVAGAIAFNVMVAAIPFLLLLVAVFGYLLRYTVDDPEQAVLDYVVRTLPSTQNLDRFVTALVDDVVQGRARFGILGLLLFVWASTRLIGTLRTALRDIFDLHEDRGIIAGKLFDIQMVLLAGSLFVANTGITVVLEAVQTFGVRLLGLPEGRPLAALQAFYAQALAFGFIFLMFVLMYRYLPARRIPWRIAAVAATFTAVVWELLKSAFAWYVAQLANYTSTYGTLTTLVILVFWIYYSALVFILGGEVAQIYELHRIRRRQKELLE